jgi:hypothetical protein
MGKLLEITGQDHQEPSGELPLTSRQVEVVLLIGRDGLSYKTAALALSNQQVRAREGVRPPHLSHHTVRRYANEIRDLMGLGHLKPMRAMWIIYQEHRKTLEEVA